MGRPSREQAEAALAEVSGRVDVRRVEAAHLPVLSPLRPVLPGLRRGQVVQVDGVGALAYALMAGASAAGSWCAVVGVPEFGVPSAAAMGCEPERLLLVDEPGERWVDAVAVLLEAVDVVLVRPPARPPSPVVRRLAAVARTSGSCLLVAGEWEGAMTRVRVASSLWTGLGAGHGHLRGRRVNVVAQGRGAAGGRPRSVWVWLPGPDGSVSPAGLVSVGDVDSGVA